MRQTVVRGNGRDYAAENDIPLATKNRFDSVNIIKCVACRRSKTRSGQVVKVYKL